jgi:hypothetical protein
MWHGSDAFDDTTLFHRIYTWSNGIYAVVSPAAIRK